MAREYDTYVTVERDDGATFELDGAPWALADKGMDSFNAWTFDVSTTPLVLDDGSALTNERLGECTRTLTALCIQPDAQAASAERYRAMQFFAAHRAYKVTVCHRGVSRYCEGLLAGFDCKLRDGRFAVELSATLLCPNPWMLDTDGNEAAFGDSLPSFGFPFVSHVRETLPGGVRHPVGFVMSREIYDGINTVWNNGDAPCGYRVVWKATGHIENPTLTKDGRVLRVVDSMEYGDTIVVDFEASPPTLTKNGENIINKAARSSSFTGMHMQVGKNLFTVDIDNPENRSLLSTQVLFHKRMSGV